MPRNSTFPQNGVNKAQAVFIEMFITAVLVLAVLMLAAEKSHVTPFAPVRIINMSMNDAEYCISDWHRTDTIRWAFVSHLPGYIPVVDTSRFNAQMGCLLYGSIHEYGTLIRAGCHHRISLL
jgi:hypothetical protein